MARWGPRGRDRKVTDTELRADVAAGLSGAEIARRRGLARASVNERLVRLGVSTSAAVAAPAESGRFVARTIDAMEELCRGMGRTNMLQDACHEWLLDAERPDRYDVGPRAAEVWVTYQEGGVRKRATLQTLLERAAGGLGVERAEARCADPRELILKTAQEVRQTVALAADLARMLADAQVMERFRETVLAEIAKESPECAERIAGAVRRSLAVSEAFRGPDGLPVGADCRRAPHLPPGSGG